MNLKNYTLDHVQARTSNTSADLNVCLAADDIIGIFDKYGFTTDTPPDVETLRHLIVEAIQNRIQTPVSPPISLVEGSLAEAKAYIEAFRNCS